MFEQMKYERNRQIQAQRMASESPSRQSPAMSEGHQQHEENTETGQDLCTHDGILLKHANAEFLSDLNTSGSLSLVEFSTGGQSDCKRMAIEWRPNDNILITDVETQDPGDWSLVDTISRRQRTVSECRVFNTSNAAPPKPRCFRSELDTLKSIEVTSRGQIIRLMRKSDGGLHAEFFFQHGNADNFVRSMQHLHVLDTMQNNRRGEFAILSSEAQKLKKTFAELNLDDIKSSSVRSSSWLSNRVVDLLVKFPDYVVPPVQVKSPRQSPVRHEEYEVLGEIKEEKTEKNAEEAEEKGQPVTESNRLPDRKILSRSSPLSTKQWCEFHTEDGRISDPTRIREVIFRGGVEPELRCEVWKYLLGYYHWDDTRKAREDRRKQKSAEYYRMKAQWLSMSTTQERNFTGYRDRKFQIEKDVERTDRSMDYFAGQGNTNLMVLQDILMTYVMYNFDLGYVQGMSDLLAPILALEQNEVDAFWCFVGFMEMVFANFDVDMAGMKRQLSDLNRLLEFCNRELFEYLKSHGSDNMFFCFRWLLVWFKREFSNDDVLELWECLWTRLPCPNYHLLVSVAILDQHTRTIVDNNFEFNEILKHINELSMRIDLRSTLELAEAIYQQIKSAENLTNDIRMIIGEEPLNVDPEELERQQEMDESFDEIAKEPTPEEAALRQQKLEEACEQSMFMSFL